MATAIPFGAFATVILVSLLVNCTGRLHGFMGGMYSGTTIRGYGWPWVFLDIAQEYDENGTTRRFPVQASFGWERNPNVPCVYAVRALADVIYWAAVASCAYLVVHRLLANRFRYTLRDLMLLQLLVAAFIALHDSGLHDRW